MSGYPLDNVSGEIAADPARCTRAMLSKAVCIQPFGSFGRADNQDSEGGERERAEGLWLS